MVELPHGVDNVRALAGRLFDQIARETKGETEAFLLRAPPAAETLAGITLDEPPTPELALQRCITALRANPGFKWVTYSMPDGRFMGAYREGEAIIINRSSILDGKTTVDEHEIQPDGTLKSIKHEDNATYDPRARPFYKLAASIQTGGWTQPYVFNENVPGITYTIAVRAGGEVTGVFTIDFHLARLSELARELDLDRGRGGTGRHDRANDRIVDVVDPDQLRSRGARAYDRCGRVREDDVFRRCHDDTAVLAGMKCSRSSPATRPPRSCESVRSRTPHRRRRPSGRVSRSRRRNDVPQQGGYSSCQASESDGHLAQHRGPGAR